ncbi:MAG: MFS transporter [Azospirillaceae bacterium]|nr:MFS transporter [Azospirillaceae bacterium]
MSAISDPEALPLAVPTRRQTALAAAAALFGWSLDLFDLFILLYVAPIVGRLFFPATEPMLSLAGAYAAFAVTLLVRPLGSALFGSYADRKGRRRALMIAVVGVGVCTAIFGLLPSVAQIGWSASGLFLLFRLIQGLFVGGVVASSHTIGTESVPERWRGLMSGVVGGGGSAMGGLFASLVFYVVTLLAPGDAFAEWGWRLMFFSGLLTSVVGLLLFRHLQESPAFKAAARKKALQPETVVPGSPLRRLFARRYAGIFFVNTIMTLGAGAGYYLTSGYLPTFLNLVNHAPGRVAAIVLIGASVAAAAGATLFGEISQHVGRKPVLLWSGVTRVVAFPILFLTLAKLTDMTSMALCVMAIAFLANGSYGPILIFLNERFPTDLRATGTGLSWNVGFAIGGMMPTAVSLVSNGPEGLPMTLAIFATAVSLLYVIGALIIPETKGNLERG